MNRRRVVFVDVDDTLVLSYGSSRIPMPRVIAQIRQLCEQGHQLWLWSSGGADYARQSASELGIEDCSTGFLPKPESYVDDQPFGEWHDCKHVLPGNAIDAGA